MTKYFNLIPYFVVLMEELSISVAAKRLGVSQPAVSKALVRLQEIYDDPLFVRTEKGYHPTQLSRDIAPRLTESYLNFRSTFPNARKFDLGTSEKTFNIGMVNGVTTSIIKSISDFVYKQSPNIIVNVEQFNTDDPSSELRHHKYDFCFSYDIPKDSALRYIKIKKEKLVIVYDKNHPRIQSNSSFSEYFKEKYVLHNKRQQSDLELKVTKLTGIEYKVARIAPGIFEMLDTIKGTELLCITQESNLKKFNHHDHFNYLPLPFDLNLGHVYLLWHSSRNYEKSHKWLKEKIIKLTE